MTTIEKVPAFKTSDGKLHEAEADALRHQARLDLRTLVEEHAYRDMGSDNVVSMLLDNLEAFSTVLARCR